MDIRTRLLIIYSRDIIVSGKYFFGEFVCNQSYGLEDEKIGIGEVGNQINIDILASILKTFLHILPAMGCPVKKSFNSNPNI